MAARFKLAIKKAGELLAVMKIVAPPVPVERVVAQVGATVRFEPFEGDLYGMVHRRPDGTAVIGVNSLDPPVRRRFTIAHELGHLVLHESEKLHIDERSPIGLRTNRSSSAEDVNEVEANQFAAALLMPEDFLRLDLRGKTFTGDNDSEQAIAALAKRYEVSVLAMTIRLNALGFLR